MFKSIRWTLQLWHAAILALALLGLGSSLYLTVKHAQLERVDTELEEAIRGLASKPQMPMMGPGGRPGGDQVSPPMQPEPMFEPDEGLGQPRPFSGPGPDALSLDYRFDDQWWDQLPFDSLRRLGQQESEQLYIVVWDNQGQMLRNSSPTQVVPFPENQLEPPSSPTDAEPVVFRQRDLKREVFMVGPFGSTFLVGKSLQAEWASLQQLRLKLLAAGVGILVVGLCGGAILAHWSLRPIKLISEAASAISGSDLSRRIVVEQGHSELGSLAQTLNQTFDRLEDAFAQQVRFTADASHELRTPLAVIHSHAELALSKERSPEDYQRALESCLRAAKRSAALVDSLLVLARADAGPKLRLESFDLKQAAQEAQSMVSVRAQERQISWEMDLKSVILTADYTRILQLLINLLSNAVQYNHKGGKIKFAVGIRGGKAEIEVADTGVGIAPEDQPHIFERFYRVDKARSRQAGGNGLGLAICKSILDMHQGEVTLASEPEQGSTFTICLPLVSTS